MRRAPERALSLFVGITFAAVFVIIGWQKVEPVANVALPVLFFAGVACSAASWFIRWRQGSVRAEPMNGTPEHVLKIIGSNLFTIVLVIVGFMAAAQFALGILPVLFSLVAFFYYVSRVVMR